MDSLFLLIPIALVFVAVAIRLLLWAIDSGQYEDLDKEGWRILNDDTDPSRARPQRRDRDDDSERSAPKP